MLSGSLSACTCRMCRIGMTKQQQATNNKLFAITYTQNQGFGTVMKMIMMMRIVVFSIITCVLISPVTGWSVAVLCIILCCYCFLS